MSGDLPRFENDAIYSERQLGCVLVCDGVRLQNIKILARLRNRHVRTYECSAFIIGLREQ